MVADSPSLDLMPALGHTWGVSDTTTEGIRVQVRPQYVAERSIPKTDVHFFAYEVTIENLGTEAAKLLSRHWVITDGAGEEEHVRGPGVVGHQPRLQPGERFQYTSFCPLKTKVGSMEGTYEMVRDDGRRFDAVVGVFTLAAPFALN